MEKPFVDILSGQERKYFRDYFCNNMPWQKTIRPKGKSYCDYFVAQRMKLKILTTNNLNMA